jgi:hypothetical protein
MVFVGTHSIIRYPQAMGQIGLVPVPMLGGGNFNNAIMSDFWGGGYGALVTVEWLEFVLFCILAWLGSYDPNCVYLQRPMITSLQMTYKET